MLQGFFPADKGLIHWNPERWVPVTMPPIIPGYYEVSNTGKVRIIHSGYMLSQFNLGNDYGADRYKGVTMKCIDGQYKIFYVHRLVAYHFIPNPENKETVNHLYRKDFNFEEYLEWASMEENNIHAQETNRIPIGEDKPNALFTNEEVIQICEYLLQGYKYGEILTALGKPNTENYRELIGCIKRKTNYADITKNYDFSNLDYGSKPKITTEQVHQICKSIADGKENVEIFRDILNDQTASRQSNVNLYDTIRNIRNKRYYKNISDQYF